MSVGNITNIYRFDAHSLTTKYRPDGNLCLVKSNTDYIHTTPLVAPTQSFFDDPGTQYRPDFLSSAIATWDQPDLSFEPPFQASGPSTPLVFSQDESVPESPGQSTDISSTPRRKRLGRRTNRGQVASDRILECTAKRRKSEGRFRCDARNCGQTFTAKHNLLNHANSHEGWKPCKCDRCGKRLGTPTTLRRHIKNLHGEGTISS
ncbi:uncharacterized protein LACBIDRAFT_302525 [Laccaria bicolor S238N-H82]|uniref:Predicted protein n=1 Tax=Laccaria bicolor (strain S238N-H82 / ATCC MYA-4686) TaxID=486041 RepID=B0DHU8_LACBS|nr:uncharacterized protein LACBIDRAFT_302525 [Laccaria bicolor S238N-H82]EDR05895.1 predicted protein [Laccaria bicolor S238N-H82]|eukprot:XP_001883571.1 predicted protein [Laccaria bicolor S238N-H82]